MISLATARIDVRRALDPDVVVQVWGSREDWLTGRREAIGASEAAMALGVSPYGTPFTLWQRKRKPKVEQKVEVLQRGHRWEPAVLAEYEDESKNRVILPRDAFAAQGPVTLSRRDLPWLRVTPDAFALDHRAQLGLVEAKTALRAHEWSSDPGIVIHRWDDEYSALVPPHYAVQGYVQLAVTGLPWVDLCALVPRDGWLGVRWVRLMRDADTQAALERALTEWHQRHLVDGEPPPIDGSEDCNRYLAAKHPSLGKSKPSRFATPEEVELMTEMAALKARQKADKERCDLLRNQLLERAQGMRLVLDNGAYGQPQNSEGRRTLDVEALRAEAPELVAKHTRKGEPFVTFNLYRFK